MGSKRKHNSTYTATARAECQSRITDHLHNRGHQSVFNVTPNLVMYWWKLLNWAVFRGKLTPPAQIICRNFRDGTLGYCAPCHTDDVHIGLRRQFDDREQFLTVLVHEMVHQYQWVTFNKMSHGLTFNSWRIHIGRAIGLPLSEYVD
jgi:hypothetical protein